MNVKDIDDHLVRNNNSPVYFLDSDTSDSIPTTTSRFHTLQFISLIKPHQQL